MASFGMKSQVKKFLKEHGVKEIRVGSKMIKLQNAKTIDLISAAAKLGYQLEEQGWLKGQSYFFFGKNRQTFDI